MRNFCFTLYSTQTPKELLNQWQSLKHIRYAIVQAELCPTTQRRHLQGYFELNRSYSEFKVLQRYLKSNLALFNRKGTQQQAIEYCMKSESQIEPYQEIGEPLDSSQGQKYNKIWDQIKNHQSMYNIVDEAPGM